MGFSAMKRLVILAAAAALPSLAHAGGVSWGDYRPTLAACIRHVQCESQGCARANPCDQRTLTWADRNWIDRNVEAIHSLPQTPAELAKSRVSAQAEGEIGPEYHGTRLGVERYVFADPDAAPDGAQAPQAREDEPAPEGARGASPTAWDQDVEAGDPGPLGGTPRLSPPRDVSVPGRDPAEPRADAASRARHAARPAVRVREGQMDRRRDPIVLRGGSALSNDDRPTKG